MPESKLRRYRREFLAGLAVAVVTAVVFGRAVGFSFVNWDDSLFVEHYNVVHWFETTWQVRLTTPHAGYPVPLPTAIYGLWHHFFGEEATWIFHLTNVVFHVVNAVLVLALLRRLKLSVPVAVAGALLWALHPVVAEPVAWVTGLKDVLSMTGILVALLGVSLLNGDDRRWWPWILVAVGPLVAMGGKPTGVVVGALMVAFVLLRVPRGTGRWKWGLAAGGFWTAVGLAISMWSYLSHDDFGGQDVTAFSIGRIFRAMEVTLRNYVLPINLAPRYVYQPPSVTAYVVGAAIVVVAGLVVWKTRKDRPVIALGVVWAAIAFAPVSNLIPINRFVADSYLYTPSLGIVVAVAAGLSAALPERKKNNGWRRRAFVGVLLALMGLMTFFQVSHWEDSAALWKRAVTVTPEDPFGYMKLGEAYFDDDRHREAIEVFEEVDARFPAYEIRTPDWPMAYCTQGMFQRCEKLLERQIAKGPRDGGQRAMVLWRQLLITYALYCERMECPIDDVIRDDRDRQVVHRAMELFGDGMSMPEVQRSIEGN